MMARFLKLGCNDRLKLIWRLRPMLLEPIAKAMIRHKLSELAKLSVEWLAINGNAMANDISDWVIARFAVHAGFRLTRIRRRFVIKGEHFFA